MRSTPATGPRNPRPNLTRGEQTTAHVMGKFIVIGPATVVVVFALWSSYTISVGMGMSRGTAAESSVLELALTGVTVAFMVWNRRRKM